MHKNKAHIIARLHKEILPLQGYKSICNNTPVDVGLGPIKKAFPNTVFPLGAIHEFLCAEVEEAAATAGFIAGIISSIMQTNGITFWISSARTLFPPALKSFGIDPEKIIFVDLQKEKEILWAMEEALKCDRLAAVVGEMQELSFIASRRLQLAVEKSQVTGFIIRRNLSKLNTTACITQWKIKHLPSESLDGLPGIGFPRWNVELLKVRNGKPGIWQIEWAAGKFLPISKLSPVFQEAQKKAG